MTYKVLGEINTLKMELSDKFKMEDLGEVNLHLGKIRRDHEKHEIYLSQP